MTPRRRLTDLQRLKVFEAANGLCNVCGRKIQSGDLWDVDHERPLALGGADDFSNMVPSHRACHRGKDSKTSADVARIAKSKRQKIISIGAHQSSRPMPGSRASKWKRKLNGRTVPR